LHLANGTSNLSLSGPELWVAWPDQTPPSQVYTWPEVFKARRNFNHREESQSSILQTLVDCSDDIGYGKSDTEHSEDGKDVSAPGDLGLVKLFVDGIPSEEDHHLQDVDEVEQVINFFATVSMQRSFALR
jgi:hypothetical protein